MFEVLFLIFIIVMAIRDKNKPTLDNDRYPGPPWISNNRKRRNGRGHYY